MDTLRIICVGKISKGQFVWGKTPLLAHDCAPDGTIQAMVDAAHHDICFYDYEAAAFVDATNKASDANLPITAPLPIRWPKNPEGGESAIEDDYDWIRRGC